MRGRVRLERQTVLLGILAVLLVVAALQFLRGGGGVGGGGGADAVDFVVQEVPVLDMAVLTPVPEGSGDTGRNPFVYGPRPTPTPDTRPRPTLPPRPTRRPPRPTPTPRLITTADGRTLPPPPPFRKKYIGYFGPEDRPVAVFREGKEVEVQVQGGVLDDVFIVREVGFNAVEIGFVGYPEEVTTRVDIEK